jgi:exonuclease III
MRFLFWNLNRRGIPLTIAELAWQEQADVVILAESAIESGTLLWALNARDANYQFARGNCGHLLFFTRFDSGFLKLLIETHRVSIRTLKLPDHDEVLIAGAHLPSKQNYSDESQVFEAVHFARLIEDAERRQGHQRTIVMGDLNMNPFESGMVAASGGLHAVMSRQVAARAERQVHQQPYKFFYNPMWSHFGDRQDIAGTYYYESGEPLCYFWNIFDQVLLRPDLIGGFAPEQVRIVREIDGRSLLKDGCPDKELVSDHLPLVLELEV